MKKKVIVSILTFVSSINLGAVAEKFCHYRSLTMLVLFGCLSMLSACAPAELTPVQKAYFDQAIQQDPNNALNYWKRAAAYREVGQIELAIDDYSKAIELDPKNARIYNGRGVCYWKLRQDWRAIEDFTRAIELDPNYASPYYNRGNLWGMLGKGGISCDDMRKACELFTKQGQRERAEDACYSVKRNCK
jgi:tetratricopeptide (TPR) repeat protein